MLFCDNFFHLNTRQSGIKKVCKLRRNRAQSRRKTIGVKGLPPSLLSGSGLGRGLSSIFKIDAFVKQVDKDGDGAMAKEELKKAGLAEMPFSFCDADRDKKLTKKEMADCKLPEAMDSDQDGVLSVNEMIEFDKKMAAAPKKKYVCILGTCVF